MTDIRRRRRWSAAVVVAPATAALFVATTSYANQNFPVTTAAPKPTRLVTATPDPRLVVLQAKLNINARKVAALRLQVDRLSGQATALASGGGNVSTASRRGSGLSSKSTKSSRLSGPSAALSRSSKSSPGSSSKRAVSNPAPPPTQATTGASGSKP